MADSVAIWSTQCSVLLSRPHPLVHLNPNLSLPSLRRIGFTHHGSASLPATIIRLSQQPTWIAEAVPGSNPPNFQIDPVGDEDISIGGDGGDSGSGVGSGGGSEEGEESRGGEEKGKKEVVAGMSMSQKLTIGYAALVGLGGVMGYLKSGSQKSLAAGGLSSALLYLVYAQLPSKPVLASAMGMAISAALLVVMGSRFKMSGKVFPAGVVSAVSLVMTGGYLHGILRSSMH